MYHNLAASCFSKPRSNRCQSPSPPRSTPRRRPSSERLDHSSMPTTRFDRLRRSGNVSSAMFTAPRTAEFSDPRRAGIPGPGRCRSRAKLGRRRLAGRTPPCRPPDGWQQMLRRSPSGRADHFTARIARLTRSSSYFQVDRRRRTWSWYNVITRVA